VALDARDRVSHVTVEAADDPSAALAAALRSHGLAGGRLRLGLDRRLAIVKAIELPRAERGDLARMIAFDLERHVPFPPEQTRFAWDPLPGETDGARRVLIVVVEARTVERALGLVAAAGRRPAALGVACHALPALLPRALRARRAVWAHRHDGVIDLLLLDGRALLTSRQVSAENHEELAREIRRTLNVARWSAAERVWLSGGAGDERDAWRRDLAAALAITASAPPLGERTARLVEALPEDGGANLLALALAVEGRRPPLDLLPPAARPWAPARGQLVTAGLLGLVAAAGLGWGVAHVGRIEQYLGRLTVEVRRLDPEVRAVDALAAELDSKRRLLAALASVEATRVPVLPTLRELTETLPADVWLQSLAMDRQGVELTGQADGASALVPLLEASPRLERAELTSPVTKTQGKEQFRIRAGWER
jgi:Tfp pilus assembly protein PilN